MPRFEVGKIYNLGGNKVEESEIKPSKPIGFVAPEAKSGKIKKMETIGFAPLSKPTELSEELLDKTKEK